MAVSPFNEPIFAVFANETLELLIPDAFISPRTSNSNSGKFVLIPT